MLNHEQRINWFRYCLKEFHRSAGEEWANGITHFVGVIFSVVAITMMAIFCAQNRSPIYTVSCVIYGTCLLVVYSISSLYHIISDFKAKSVFQLLDHCSIYLLIAGSYMPFTLLVLSPQKAWVMFGIEWGLALAGILVECLCSRRKADISSLPIFLVMGWLIVGTFVDVYRNLSTPAFVLLCTGGGVYTIGVIFFLFDRVPYMHTVWHVFVLSASICHWVAITFFIVL